MKTIFFDMDGTLCALYDVPNWLEKLRALDPAPYADAAPMHNMSLLARLLNQLKRRGFKLGIISWLSKEPTPEYDEAVIHAKEEWLNKQLTSVSWDEKWFVPYGTSKSDFITDDNDILFDDEEKNRTDWQGIALDPTQIFSTLKLLSKLAPSEVV